MRFWRCPPSRRWANVYSKISTTNLTLQHKISCWALSESQKTSFTWQTGYQNHHMTRILIRRGLRKRRNQWKNENWRNLMRMERCLISSKGNRVRGIRMCRKRKRKMKWDTKGNSRFQCCENRQQIQIKETQKLMQCRRSLSPGMARKATKYSVTQNQRNQCQSSSLRAQARVASMARNLYLRLDKNRMHRETPLCLLRVSTNKNRSKLITLKMMI